MLALSNGTLLGVTHEPDLVAAHASEKQPSITLEPYPPSELITHYGVYFVNI